ncbi:heterokaryon incompatibility protein-domain-containing protein [Xylariaceae sp. FL0255]|nr:heterokaryon incompatibility protein-domain-containing protein [Xylariaceae sp. FL0255]
MRLLDVNTLLLKNFYNEKNTTNRYAILSHRWLHPEDEVTFHDIQSLDISSMRRKKGYFKLFETSKLAKSQGLSYVWIDTCCIDRSDSSELQEAINSMYRWYHQAATCYVYLGNEGAILEESCQAIRCDLVARH